MPGFQFARYSITLNVFGVLFFHNAVYSKTFNLVYNAYHVQESDIESEVAGGIQNVFYVVS